MLESVDAHVPELLPFQMAAYSQATHIQFGKFNVVSDEGVQDGVPLGPLPFLFNCSGVTECV